MTLTDYLKLKKPGYTDPADIGIINENMDALDEKCAELDAAVGGGPGSGAGVEINQNETLPTNPEWAVGGIVKVLGWFANMLAKVTGKTYWWQPPKKSVETICNDLDNKVTGAGWIIYTGITSLGLPSSAALNDIIAAMPSKSVLYNYCDADTSDTVTPYPAFEGNASRGKYGLLTITKERMQRIRLIFTPHEYSGMFFATYNQSSSISGAPFFGWSRAAAAQAQTKIVMPLASGFSNYKDACYYKDQFGVVHVQGTIQKSSALSVNDVISTLPVGYRPSAALERPASYNAPPVGGTIGINTNGSVTVLPATAALSGATFLSFDISFIAAV